MFSGRIPRTNDLILSWRVSPWHSRDLKNILNVNLTSGCHKQCLNSHCSRIQKRSCYSTRNCSYANVYLFNNLCNVFLASIAAWRIGCSFAVPCLFPWLCESPLLALWSLVSWGLVFSLLRSEHFKDNREINALFSNFHDDVLIVAARTSLSWLVIRASSLPNFQASFWWVVFQKHNVSLWRVDGTLNSRRLQRFLGYLTQTQHIFVIPRFPKCVKMFLSSASCFQLLGGTHSIQAAWVLLKIFCV